MANDSAKFLKGLYDSSRAMGDKAISSDGTMEIVGFEGIALLIKQFPWATLSTAGEIEIPMPNGAAAWQPQQAKINQQGQVSFMETKSGIIDATLLNILSIGGRFDAKLYEGTPDKYKSMKLIKDCFIQLDNPDRDWENRSQVLMFTGTMFFHYFGESIPGNA